MLASSVTLPSKSSDDASVRELAAVFLSPHGLQNWPPAINVSAFLAWAAQEGVVGLLYDRTRADSAADLPPALVEGLRSGAHRQAAREVAQRGELRRLVAAIRTSGVEMLLMKGASLAYQVYPDPAWRVRADVDVLIRAGDRDRVRSCLDEIGYMCEPQVAGRFATYQFHAAHVDAHGVRHLCDVHWKIANPQRFANAILFDELAQAAVQIPALGPDARGLGRAHALWLACVHRVAHHADRDPLPWLYDVHLLVEALDAADTARFITLAARTGVRRICLNTLVLARTRFGTTMPQTALTALEAEPVDEPSAVFLSPGLRPFDVLLDDLRVLASWRARLTLLKEHLFPSAAYVRYTYAQGSSAPLPWLYVRRVVTGASKWFRR
jgi:putative nucleotidyltransferase-like protein